MTALLKHYRELLEDCMFTESSLSVNNISISGDCMLSYYFPLQIDAIFEEVRCHLEERRSPDGHDSQYKVTSLFLIKVYSYFTTVTELKLICHGRERSLLIWIAVLARNVIVEKSTVTV